MNALPKPMTIDEFVAWEQQQELRYEFDGFAARAMTGGTFAHAGIQANLLRALFKRMTGGPCVALGSDPKVRTDASVRCPEALITCSGANSQSTFAPDPGAIFEILSKSSAQQDLGARNVEYQAISSPKRYVVLHQSLAAAQVFHREDEGGWPDDFLSADGTLDFPEVGASIPLLEIYEGFEFAS
jgi:Uma2 family endonuclease